MLYFPIMTADIKALLFDFDGLILDTETPELRVWKRMYREYGLEYPMEKGILNIGRWGNAAFNPAKYLHEITHDSLDPREIMRRHYDESVPEIRREPVGAGVKRYMAQAPRLGLRLAVASSSERWWVESHLYRLQLIHRFDVIITGDDVPAGRVKPHPDIYLKALQDLDVTAKQAIAFEDSPPGVAAARAAGIFTVAVPNPTTAPLDFSEANLLLVSLAALPLKTLLQLKDFAERTLRS